MALFCCLDGRVLDVRPYTVIIMHNLILVVMQPYHVGKMPAAYGLDIGVTVMAGHLLLK